MMENKNNRLFKRFVSVLIVVLGIIVTVASFSGCRNELNIQQESVIAIGISSLPHKTDYIRGEKLDLTGLVVYEVKSNGSQSNYDDYKYVNSGDAYISGNTTDYTTTPAAGEILNETGLQKVVVERVIKDYKKRQAMHLQAEFIIAVSD